MYYFVSIVIYHSNVNLILRCYRLRSVKAYGLINQSTKFKLLCLQPVKVHSYCCRRSCWQFYKL